MPTSLAPLSRATSLSIVSRVAVIAIGLVAPLGVRSAAACSPPIPPAGYGSLIPNVPLPNATDVPTNGVVILDEERIGGLPKGTTVSVTEETTGAPVPGSFQTYYWDRALVVWRSVQPLKPQTGYRIEAVVTSEAPRPSSATGAAELSLTFTTGSGTVPPLASQGQMQVRLETYLSEREDWSRCASLNSCGVSDNCNPAIVREQRSRARVTVPAVSGGLSEPGYQVLVPVTADTPYEFPRDEGKPTGVLSVGSGVGVRPNAPSEILVELDALATQRPCFALRVNDLAGNTFTGDPVCPDATVEPVRNLDQGGCRVAGEADAPLWACPALLGLLWHARRRRRPTPLR